MIETATAFTSNQAREDAGYKSWSAAGKTSVMKHDPEARTAAAGPVFGSMVKDAASIHHHAYAPSSASTGSEAIDLDYASTKDDDGYSFGDIIDIINPLQHLPVIGTLYRQFTGDTIKPFSNIIGGAIFGGPVGAVSSTVNVIVKDRTGKDLGETAMALAGFSSDKESTSKAEIVYDKTATVANTSSATIQDMATAAYLAADGRKNFAARNIAQTSWNA